ncbi:YaaR family protein [Halanaerobaculum tunisiense]
MKIQNSKAKSQFNKSIGSNQQINQVKGKNITFLEELKQVHGTEAKAKLDELLGLIDKQGEKLAEHRTFKELVKYKKMVQNFVNEAVEKMYQVKEDYSPTQGKVQTIVKSVDGSLEELTNLIVDNQSAQLDILDQLDEVRGLLIDLYR